MKTHVTTVRTGTEGANEGNNAVRDLNVATGTQHSVFGSNEGAIEVVSLLRVIEGVIKHFQFGDESIFMHLKEAGSMTA